jgi:S1-C subfamily serine protease
MSVAFAILLVLWGSGPAAAQVKPEVIDRGKRAAALVEVAHAGGVTLGSGFCIKQTGLFITTARVVERAVGKTSTVRLVVDIGSETQRVLRAKVLRLDDEVNLALLQVDGEASLMLLEPGRDSDLRELAEVVTFGYPLGRMLAVGRATYPDVTVMPDRITSLARTGGGSWASSSTTRSALASRAGRCSTPRGR